MSGTKCLLFFIPLDNGGSNNHILMPGNVKYTTKIFLVNLMYINSNEHMKKKKKKKGFQHPNCESQIILFWLVLLLDSQHFI